MVWAVLALTLGAAREHLASDALALVIVAAQSAFFFRFAHWAPRLLVRYLGFALFCWTLTVSDVAQAGPARVAGRPGWLVLRGVAFVVFAHLTGFVLLVR